MIARFLILLPFDLFITEADDWPVIELASAEDRFRVYAPALYAERPNAISSVMGQMFGQPSPPSFDGAVSAAGCKIAQVNVLTVDVLRQEFDRRDPPDTPPDPSPELVFDVANQYLARIRVCSRSCQIKPLVPLEDAWQLHYLTDDFQPLEPEAGKVRFHAGFYTTIGPAAVSPAIIDMVATNWGRPEPYAWDQLLLDARALLPDVGSAVVMAAAALETFISWALNILHEQQQLPGTLWNWIIHRNGKPSASEQFDVLLRVFTGRSLKDDQPRLWRDYGDLREARNALAHEGHAKLGSRPLTPRKAKEFIDAAEAIVGWVEALLPEAHRRARAKAIGPVARRMATPEEAGKLGVRFDGPPAPVQQGSRMILDFRQTGSGVLNLACGPDSERRTERE